MTIEIVEQRLDTLLSAHHAKVLLLTGGWGAGKTHQWKQALRRASAAGNQPPKYAYVSLFGLMSLAEVRKRVAEEIVAAIKIPGSDGTLGETVEEGGWRLRPFQILKLLPVIPYLGKLEGLANELSFLSVRNAVICFDDLERAGSSLRLADVFGLASFLKEERNCKVILISNETKLDGAGKDDLTLYLEKVVDETVNFAPTAEEACDIALGGTPDPARAQLREHIRALGISNIRVIGRLSSMTAELAIILGGFHKDVLQEAIHALALFGAARFLPSDGFPSVEYLMNFGSDWGHFLRNGKTVEEETDEERQVAAWETLLGRYKYTETSTVDSEIGRAVQNGYFDRSKLIAFAQQQSDNFEVLAKRAAYHDAWHKFWHSLNGNSQQLLNDLFVVTIDAIGCIGPGDLQPAYDVFNQAGKPDEAADLLEKFIEKNKHQPIVFEQVDGSFRDMFTGPFADRLRAEGERLKVHVPIEKVLDRIDFEHGWNSEDIRIVSKIGTDEIEELLRNTEGRLFRTRLRTLLRIGSIQDAQEDEKRVSRRTVELLRKLANDDPIIAIRMRQYLPAEGNSFDANPT